MNQYTLFNESIDGAHFDAVIIGAGMSGLAAGIRLAQFQKKVLILEKHNAVGGLNSFYSKKGVKYDVGLHALTNYVPLGVKGTPLGRIFRQLRLSREDWDLAPQNFSAIRFPSVELKFSNDLSYLLSEISAQFSPKAVDEFLYLKSYFTSMTEAQLLIIQGSARQFLAQHISDPLLREMILCPVLFYGSSWEYDMPVGSFGIIFRSIFLEGLSRPFEGVRVILRSLVNKYRELGGLRKMKTAVHKMFIDNHSVHSIHLTSGEVISSDYVISSAGFAETMQLCQLTHQETNPPQNQHNVHSGKLSFVETINLFPQLPSSEGLEETIVFFNDSDKFNYSVPSDLIDLRSGVICIPNNYLYSGGRNLDYGAIRVTVLANFDKWNQLSPEDYLLEKKNLFAEIQQKAIQYLGQSSEVKSDLSSFYSNSVAEDMFTPKTIYRYTGHENGAVYGNTYKTFTGETPYRNLFICGSDQGLVGIVGSILSGITIANQQVLSPSGTPVLV